MSTVECPFLALSLPFLFKGDSEQKKRAGTVIGISVNLACLLGVLIQPYMPALSRNLESQLAVPPTINFIPTTFSALLPPGHRWADCTECYT